ncbi:hypothetical protein BGZ60DRAFT_528190 [Tricladium varicosporioides]|nr:hypothetical protein BGZ60DRAFT_528190 [Hymenoscyphus varicosporioides]
MPITPALSRGAFRSFNASFLLRKSNLRVLKLPVLRPRNITTSTPRKPPARKSLFPERLLVYHAGTGRTVFVGSLKITTIFICSFFCIFVGPTFFNAEDPAPMAASIVVLSGIVPMVFVMYISRPFVNFIHLRLPPFARNSREIMMRYSKNLPKDAEIDITTMNLLGKAQVARMKVTDLYPVRERFGMVNYARDTKEINSKRKWWMPPAIRQFGVHSGRSRIMGGEVWDNIAMAISRNARLNNVKKP